MVAMVRSSPLKRCLASRRASGPVSCEQVLETLVVTQTCKVRRGAHQLRGIAKRDGASQGDERRGGVPAFERDQRGVVVDEDIVRSELQRTGHAPSGA